MIKDILIDVEKNQIMMAALEDERVVDIRVEDVENQSRVGDIYRGKVKRVMPGMQAAFVDIGLDKNAYLYVKDIYASRSIEDDDLLKKSNDLPDISQYLSAGQEITVQIIKDQAGEKGPRATTQITLAGRYSVLMPQGDFTAVSKKIEDTDERARLIEIASNIKKEPCGIIVRTAAEEVDKDLLEDDIKELQALWQHINKMQQRGKVPRILHAEAGVIGFVLREYLSTKAHRILVNDKETYESIVSSLRDQPDLMKKVRYYNQDYDMLDFYGVRNVISEALSRRVWLKSGAYLIFDYTEALTVIDVNTGRFIGKTDMEETALKINLEAAKAVAQQIRLRNISGIIIIDFIDMVKKEHRQELLRALREYVKDDKIHTVVVDMTKLGLVEMTRKKVRLPLAAYLK